MPRKDSGGDLDFAVVSVEDVSRHYGRRRAISRLSFRATGGTILGLLGPNGAGKSTLLGLLATQLRPSSGRICYGEISTDGAAPSALRGRIGVLGHDLFLYPDLTARENLAFFAALYSARDADLLAQQALEGAGLGDRGDDLVSSLSRGMRQRVALERALIGRPRLVLLDEPFTGLDDASADALTQRLQTLRREGAIVVVATHDLDMFEGLPDQVVFLRDGRLLHTTERPEGVRSLYRAVMERGQA